MDPKVNKCAIEYRKEVVQMDRDWMGKGTGFAGIMQEYKVGGWRCGGERRMLPNPSLPFGTPLPAKLRRERPSGGDAKIRASSSHVLTTTPLHTFTGQLCKTINVISTAWYPDGGQRRYRYELGN